MFIQQKIFFSIGGGLMLLFAILLLVLITRSTFKNRKKNSSFLGFFTISVLKYLSQGVTKNATTKKRRWIFLSLFSGNKRKSTTPKGDNRQRSKNASRHKLNEVVENANVEDSNTTVVYSNYQSAKLTSTMLGSQNSIVREKNSSNFYQNLFTKRKN